MICEGKANAPIVVVGDAPTMWEYQSGRALSDHMHNLILDFLEQAKLPIDKVCYVPCFSGPKTYGLKFDGPILQDDAKEHLIPFLRQSPRKLVIALGNNALCAVGVTDKPEGINSHTSRRLKSPNLDAEVCAAIHPAFVAKEPDENGIDFVAQLRYAKRLFDGDFSEQVAVVVENLDTPESINQMLVEAKQGYDLIAFDIESSGLDRLMDIVVTRAFHNGLKTAAGVRVGRLWAGYDRLRPLYEEHVLKQFNQAFREFYSRSGIDYGRIGANVKFDDGIEQTNLSTDAVGQAFVKRRREKMLACVPHDRDIDWQLPHADYDTNFLKWVTNKFGNNGLKEDVTRLFGYPDYEKEVTEIVKEIADRRGKQLDKNDHACVDDFFVLDYFGLEPIEGKYVKKTDTQFYKWPEGVDKKLAAYAMVPLEKLGFYNVLDAVYTYMRCEHYLDLIDGNEGWQQSAELRHRFGRRLMQCELQGLKLDVDTNRALSRDLEEISVNSDQAIRKEIARLNLDWHSKEAKTDSKKAKKAEEEEFNPNSQPQLRRVLFGEAMVVPHIDERSLLDYWDWKKVREKLGMFHDKFYQGYGEILDLSAKGLYSADVAREHLKEAFAKFMGRSSGITFEPVPRGGAKDESKVYVSIVDRKVFPSGLYQPDPKAVTKGGEPSVSAEVLKNLFATKQEPLLQYILMRNKAVKMKGTFVDGMFSRLSKDGILRGEYNALGAKTGRISSKAPNFQNFPSYIRGQFVARPGYRFVGWDLGQAEVRVIAALSQDADLMAALYTEDFHKATASLVTGVPIGEIDKVTRQAFKTLNFGLIYGMSSYKLAITLGIDVEAAEELMERYFARFPALAAWLKNQRKIAGEYPYHVSTVFGTTLGTRNMLSSDKKVVGHTERQAMNAPIQGTAGELTLWYIDEMLTHFEQQGWDVKFVNTTHDSCTFEVPEALCDAVAAYVKWRIEECVVPFAPLDAVKFTTDIEVTDRWYGEPNLMKALEADYGTDKQTMPWHLILGVGADKEEREELEEIEELEEAYYAARDAA